MWKNGSALGNSTVDPRVMATSRGTKPFVLLPHLRPRRGERRGARRIFHEDDDVGDFRGAVLGRADPARRIRARWNRRARRRDQPHRAFDSTRRRAARGRGRPGVTLARVSDE